MSVYLCRCMSHKALVKQRQAEDELARLQDALTTVVNEAGARTRQEVPYSADLIVLFAEMPYMFEVCVVVHYLL